MMSWIVIMFAVLASAAARDYHLSLEGLHGIHVKGDNLNNIQKVKSFESVDGFDLMKLPRTVGDNFDILVEASKVKSFKKYLDENRIEYEVFTNDFQAIIDAETVKQNMSLRHAMPRKGYGFRHFPRHSEINDYLESVSSQYSSLVTLINIGKSHEQRDTYAVKISTGGLTKPVVFIDAGIHAREWIAPTTALYFVNELVKPKNRYLLDKVDVVVIPSINPDGYEYTHTAYRLWRKTRSYYGNGNCFGVDANRNFGYKWNLVGASQSPCSDIYSGPAAFSEIESRNVRDFLLSFKGSVKVYLSLHSYGQMMLHPWGWTRTLPDNEPLLRKVGVVAAEAIENVRGKSYTVGSSTVVLYAAAGGSDDWAMAVGGADISYTLELPGGRGGFVIDPEEIVNVGYETFEAVKVFMAYAASTVH